MAWACLKQYTPSINDEGDQPVSLVSCLLCKLRDCPVYNSQDDPGEAQIDLHAFMSAHTIVAKQRKLRRELEKHLRGYMSEAVLYASYSLKAKSDPQTKFMIFCYQRTGSTLLVNLLDSHPLVHCEGELLLNRLASPRRYIACRAATSPGQAFGFKLQPHHFTYQGIRDPQEFVAWLDSSGYRIIKLTRRNYFRAALSLYYAITTGKFHQVGVPDGQGQEKLTVDPQELLAKIAWIEHSSQLLDSYTGAFPYLELVYEEHLMAEGQHQATVDLICDWLGLAHAPVGSKYVKMMPQDISQFVRNAAEIEEFIRNTKYGELLELP
jgi:LPS sulfotransferase NodH